MTGSRMTKGLQVLGALSLALLAGAPTLSAQQSPGADAARRRDVDAVRKPPLVADAAMRRDVAAVRKLIAQGTNVNVPQGDGMTALHWAAEQGNTEMAGLLLRAGAKVGAVTRIGGYTPLHIASKSGSAAIVKALLNAKSNANVVTTSGATALHFAAAAGSVDAVNALLDHKADINAREMEWGQTPLIFAAANDRGLVIRALLKRGADASVLTKVVSLTEQASQEQAATRKRNEVMASFQPKPPGRDSAAGTPAVARTDSAKTASPAPAPAMGGGGGYGGAGPSAAAPGPPKKPLTPSQVQAAIEAGRTLLTAAPNAGIKVEDDTTDGQVAGYAGTVGNMGGLSALHHAVRQGNLEAVAALLDGSADINQPSEGDHTTPLLLATINGQFDVAMRLIERGANPNLASTAGATPLYTTINTEWAPKSRFPQPEAVQNQKATYLEVMEALLKAGADPNVRIKQHLWYFAYNNCGNANCGLENLEGTTPFWRAAYAVDIDAMRLLVKYHADPNIPSQRAPQVARGGGAGGRGGRGGGRGAPDSATAAAFAQRGGGGGGGRGGRGQLAPVPSLDPAIDSAAKAAPVGLGTYPIHAAAGVGYGNGFAGNSHRHAPDGWMPALKYLVEELGANVNERDATGYTPLHHAAARGDNEMILYLVSKGADPKAVSKNGRTTVDMANGPVQRLRPFPETIALLEKLGAKNQHRCVSC
jgi:ankyrin repeat protein